MIPIECPNCGRGGNVPPDRLNARLVCKACHSVFHMDSGGRMVLGEPGETDPKKKPKQPKSQAAAPDFEFSQAWKDIPKPVKYAVPAFLLAFLFWQFNPIGGGSPAYRGRAEEVARALTSNDRAKLQSFATSATTDPAGKWFDLIRGQLEQKKVGPDASITISIFNGNPERDSTLTLSCLILDGMVGTAASVPVTLIMTRDGSTWKLDGARSLAEGEGSFPPSTRAKKG